MNGKVVMHEPQLRIGCSGWNYKSWKGRFYPATLKTGEWLKYYATRFDTVEINNTFYRLPEGSTFVAWRKQTPDDFLIAVKASRFLTHLKRLRDPEEPTHRLFSRVNRLGPRLGPVLYQLPGNFHIDLERLEQFLKQLPQRLPGRHPIGLRHVFESRDPSWYVPATFELLDRYKIALCLHDKKGSEISDRSVGPFVYIRFHGTSGHYTGSYSPRSLEMWAERLVEWWSSGCDVFAYFNNDPEAVATANAASLRDRVERLLGREVSQAG